MAGPKRNPWGREIRESKTTAWGRPRPPELEDFTEVGLVEADATAALEGLRNGEYLSFEDACLSTAIFGTSNAPPGIKFDESLMRSKAREFARVSEAGS